MAYPPIIQKIFDLRRSLKESEEQNTRLCSVIAKLVEGNIRMCQRITMLELGRSDAEENAGLPICMNGVFPPEGYELLCGAKVAPLTLVKKENAPHPGAAFTVILDNVETHKGE